jgi:uncharacterized surface protein with fasciclin (FAS1) repeats
LSPCPRRHVTRRRIGAGPGALRGIAGRTRILQGQSNMKIKSMFPILAAAAALAAAPTVVVAQAHGKTIAEVAATNGNFKTLTAALQAAGLVETLKGKGPFTVFAPTDEAFAKLPAGTVEALLADKEKLTAVLTYHVVGGKVTGADVAKMMSAKPKTVNGAPLSINVREGKVMVNDARVTTADVAASNGVIHVIDTVLLPPAAGAGSN